MGAITLGNRFYIANGVRMSLLCEAIMSLLCVYPRAALPRRTPVAVYYPVLPNWEGGSLSISHRIEKLWYIHAMESCTIMKGKVKGHATHHR